MTCEYKYNEKGEVVMIFCGGPWGVGVTTLYGEDAEACGGSIYGFSHGGNPHDFHPDYESCTPQEIAAHKEAKEAWDKLHGQP